MSANPALATPSIQLGATLERRQYYRLRYPLAERPRMVMGARKYEVVDCSVRGLRYSCPPTTLMKPGDKIVALLQFKRRKAIPVRGRIVHILRDQVGLQLQDSEIPLPTIWDEERYLRKYFPMPENPTTVTNHSS